MGALEKNNVMLIEEFPLVIIGLVDDDLCIQSLWLLKQQVDISNCFKNKIKYIQLQRSATTQVLSTILVEWGYVASHFLQEHKRVWKNVVVTYYKHVLRDLLINL